MSNGIIPHGLRTLSLFSSNGIGVCIKKLALKKVSESVAFKFPMLHFSQRAIITTIVIMIKMVSLAGGWGSFNPWSCPKDPAVHLISLPFSSFHWH